MSEINHQEALNAHQPAEKVCFDKQLIQFRPYMHPPALLLFEGGFKYDFSSLVLISITPASLQRQSSD
jgi:hypothetical protein